MRNVGNVDNHKSAAKSAALCPGHLGQHWGCNPIAKWLWALQGAQAAKNLGVLPQHQLSQSVLLTY